MSKKLQTSINFNANASFAATHAVIDTFNDKECDLAYVKITKNKDQISIDFEHSSSFTMFRFGCYYKQHQVNGK